MCLHSISKYRHIQTSNDVHSQLLRCMGRKLYAGKGAKLGVSVGTKPYSMSG